MLSVKDNGAGMGATERQAVLAEAEDSDQSPGHGIGLRNVIRRIHLSTNGRGRVELHSPGEGLEVRVLLPGQDEGALM